MTNFQEIATDTAKLQSAWSAYDRGHYGGVENRAAEAFVDCVNQFVYFDKLRTPLPETEKGITNPFMDLWFENSKTPFPSENPFAQYGAWNEIEQAKEVAIKRRFLLDIEREPDKYISFLQFQLCSEQITEEYISRTQGAKTSPAGLIGASRDLLGGINSAAIAAISNKLNGLELTKWHRAVCKQQLQCTIGDYALCYAYSVFRRGRQYQECLGGCAYDPHWIRVASQYLQEFDETLSASDPYIGFANWGRIILGLQEVHILGKNEEQFKDLLSSVRNSVQSGKFSLSSDEKNDQVVILENAKQYAKYSRDPWHFKISEYVKETTELIPGFGKLFSRFVTIVDMFAKSRVVEAIDAKLTRMMSFQQYQQRFYLPGVMD